ncbi:M16 family metallopeptidase [Acidithiobacillus sp. IBUN Pt1247-S3]|uniref:M16 family metallopeptidase n=1 Tax=Acidithiobacillus sp. IBUN Pt1247-S3 TaxID=3166642 RepID=UPI0034E462B0
MNASASLQQLPNGIRFFAERVAGRRQVAISVTALRGSRHQQPEENGFAHLLEHMLFKGAAGRDAAEINRLGERLGGTLNAFTDRESVTLHLTVLAEDQSAGLNLLADLLLCPTFTAKDLVLERAVVAQEIAMAAEDLEDYLQEQATNSFWGDDSLGWPVLGKASLVRRVSAQRLRAFHQDYLANAPILIAAVGAVDENALVKQVEARFAALPPRPQPISVAPPMPYFASRRRRSAHARQAHLLWMGQASAFADQDHLAELFANHILGAGMASRLFQELRERRGLAYQTYSQLEALSDTGEWSLYAAVPPGKRQEAAKAIGTILTALVEEGPTEEEMHWSRAGLRKQWLLGEEDLETRMARRVRQVTQGGRLQNEEEILERLHQISATNLREVCARSWSERLEWSLLPG